jgi:hypothetical protein
MSKKFVAGDILRCIDGCSYSDGDIVTGFEYEFVSYNDDDDDDGLGGYYINVKGHGQTGDMGWFPPRFKFVRHADKVQTKFIKGDAVRYIGRDTIYLTKGCDYNFNRYFTIDNVCNYNAIALEQVSYMYYDSDLFEFVRHADVAAVVEEKLDALEVMLNVDKLLKEYKERAEKAETELAEFKKNMEAVLKTYSVG